MWATWLTAIRSVVDWLVDVAWYGLSQFLFDPVGFVVGVYRASFLFWLEAIRTYEELLYAVITEVLSDIYNFWALYRDTLWDFFTDPVTFILDQIAEPFLDWACGLVADQW